MEGATLGGGRGERPTGRHGCPKQGHKLGDGTSHVCVWTGAMWVEQSDEHWLPALSQCTHFTHIHPSDSHNPKRWIP